MYNNKRKHLVCAALMKPCVTGQRVLQRECVPRRRWPARRWTGACALEPSPASGRSSSLPSRRLPDLETWPDRRSGTPRSRACRRHHECLHLSRITTAQRCGVLHSVELNVQKYTSAHCGVLRGVYGFVVKSFVC